LKDHGIEAMVRGAMDCLGVIGALLSETAERAYRKGLADALGAHRTNDSD
jgi:hypothetical protein